MRVGASGFRALVRGAAAATAALVLASCAGTPDQPPLDPSREPGEVLAELAGGPDAPLPGLAVSVLLKGEVVYRGVAGLRRRGSPETVQPDDAFHIGSDTKAMTALLCGILVDRGLLSWDSAVGDILGPRCPMRDEYRGVTLVQLLSHGSGLPSALPLPRWLGFFPWNSAAGADRAAMTEAILALKPRRAPGAGFEYSNLGYVVAGRMAEIVAGKSWETLMREEIFEPLGMARAGFGPPAYAPLPPPPPPAGAAAPWGHSPAAVPPDAPAADNPAALGPAGTVHASLADLERYLALYWRGGTAEGGRRLVSAESLAQIQSPRLGSYALGWGVGTSGDGGRYLVHDGSNTMFYCSLLVVPEDGDAIIVLTNRGDGDVPRIVERLVRYLAARFLGG